MNLQSSRYRVFLLTLPIILLACRAQKQNFRQTVDLSGKWQFSADTANIGIRQKWYLSSLQDSIELPGTTDLCQKGFLNRDTTTLHLNRLYQYEGPAWYRRMINIPRDFQGKHIQLIMERTKSSKVWIDDHYVGKSRLLQSPQYYDLSPYLSPGQHSITIRINNDLKLTPYGNVHIYTDETQTNWNGIIGNFVLEVAPKTYISNLQVFPDINNQKIKIQIAIVNGLGFENVDITLRVNRNLNGKKKELKTVQHLVPCDSLIQLAYKLGNDMALWDDYEQPLYQLTATINNDKIQDSRSISFGMRRFTVAGKQFTINGRTTFLRGKNDACVFPLTGHPPMDSDGWDRVYKIAKSYGINHYRFHSYCPPEAAFEAADQLGIFLQPELPFWGGLESDTVTAMLKEEGLAMLRSYGNHPSFVMYGPGNEIWSGHDRIENVIVALEKRDNRHLYTMGANNNIGYVEPRQYSDFHIAARTPSAQDTILTHLRLTHAFVDSKDGGILNTQRPSTMVNYDYPVSQINVPLVSHEIGQYQIYPDYKEIQKYTGVVRAWNLKTFRNRLSESGLLDQNVDFLKASGAWSAICYKAEMEAALRTRKLAGFQLLDLQDYPGQGTALVGILDAFMDSKHIISREEWLKSCNDVVLLLLLPKFCWQTNENFQAKLQVANYSNKTITDDIIWQLTNKHGELVKTGTFLNLKIAYGGLKDIGEINVSLDSLTMAEKLTVNLAFKRSGYTNTYPVWVFPMPKKKVMHQNIIVVEKLNNDLISKLQSGEKVLFFPTAESVEGKSVAGLFPPDFWNYGMFKGISKWAKKPISPGTLGLLADPAHPIFNNFPTDFHTNWQWWSIIKASRPLLLNKTAHHYRPIVQVIDNVERNNKFGLIFELAFGKGKLLVCMARLNDIMEKPEAYQLYESIISYMKSDDFNPDYSVDIKLLYDLFQQT